MRSGVENYLWRGSAGLVALACLLTGCHKTVMVFGPSTLPPALAPNASQDERVKAAKNELPGIPFYNHYGVCNRETIWLEPQTTLSLTVAADGGTPVTQTITLNNQSFRDPGSTAGHDAASLVTRLLEVQGEHKDGISARVKRFCPADVAQGWAAVRDAYKVAQLNEDSASMIASDESNNILLRVLNTADVGTAVDYSRIYYLNAKSPLIGTGSVDARLNPDGTLGEGSASVNDETLGAAVTAAAAVGSGGLAAWSAVAAAGITGAATVKAAASGASGIVAQLTNREKPPALPACEARDGWPEVKDSVRYEFSMTPGGFKHDHKKVTPLEKELNGECLVSDVVIGGSYAVTPIGGDGKADKNAIGVSGTITLPKADSSGTPKP